MSQTITRDSIAERVKQLLLKRIMTGELAAGERLIELKIARELNTSQAPVREALRELEAMELVVTEPYKGSRVREVTEQDMREAYQVRASLEELAGQLAAVALKGNTEVLRKEAEKIQKAAKGNSVEQYSKHDYSFHRMIVEASGNRILLRTWESLAFDARIQIWLAKGRVSLSKAQEDHWPVMEALEAGNGKLAGKLLREHLISFSVEEGLYMD